MDLKGFKALIQKGFRKSCQLIDHPAHRPSTPVHGDGQAGPLSEKATVEEPYEIKETTPANINSVKHLLLSTDEGKIIMSSYEKNKSFLRNDSSRMIVKNKLKKSSDKKISTARFKELAKEFIASVHVSFSKPLVWFSICSIDTPGNYCGGINNCTGC
ncbi:hypothetical protein JTB14_005604 [Gonioctena quinquepunctata]|nr:hypothetical protein JTB14_005604 [Gonioctena quinquepunctata]